MPTQFKTQQKTLEIGQLGTITGLELTPHGGTESTCSYIGGLPYSLPPIGDYRFRAPRGLPADFKYGSAQKPGLFIGYTNRCPQVPTRHDQDTGDADEDCLQTNIWLPSGAPPQGGWPILFFIHGGFLQWGTANMPPTVIANMLHETTFKAIVVMPAYRLNLFGFLTSPELEAEARKAGETYGNMGFWDQRMALEWTKKNASVLGGDPTKITVAGYSAGSYSTFQQLAHDLDQPTGKQCISRAIMFSNGPGVPSKSVTEAATQFNELLRHLGIDHTLSARQKLERLRAVDVKELVAVQDKMVISEFRAVNDGAFINPALFQTINDGTFAKKCKARGIKIMNGECSEEWFLYGSWRTPKNSYEALFTRLAADYPRKTAEKLMALYVPDKKLPAQYENWEDAFGKIYSDVQVYAMERGFAHKLHANGFISGTDLLRYRIEWRAGCVQMPPEWGVTHATDMAIWFWGAGQGDGLTDKEKKVLAPLSKVFADFVGHEPVEWSEKGIKKQLTLRADGKTVLGDDTMWDHGLSIWKALAKEEKPGPKL